MITAPLGGLVGLPALAIPVGSAGGAIGGVALGCLVLGALVIVLADRQKIA